MSEQQGMNQFMDEIDKSMMSFDNGDILKGKVISVGKEDVIVNIGHMSDGVISKMELSHDGSMEPADVVSEGDEIDVYVLKVNDEEGQVVLSKKRADQVVVWDEMNDCLESGKPVEVTIKEVVKGGAVAYIKGIRAFIPASQLSVNYVEDLNSFTGQTMMVKVIEVNKEKKSVILSRKQIESDEREVIQKQLWDKLSVGDILDGEVKRLESFGAFIDIGGLDGLAHVSALSWQRVKHPSEVVSVGDKVEVEVLDVDKKKQRLSLKVLNAQENPWNQVEDKYNVDDVINGTVVRLTDFGAFIKLDSGIEGLVHISEICNSHINHPKDELEVGQEVKVRIMAIKPSEQRMSLSIKAVDGEAKVTDETIQSFANEGDASVTLGDKFGDVLSGLFK